MRRLQYLRPCPWLSISGSGGVISPLVRAFPLPPFAKEMGARSWAQLFLKWILGHPAVTVVIPATSDPEHLTDDLGAGFGPLPDEALRRRLLAYLGA